MPIFRPGFSRLSLSPAKPAHHVFFRGMENLHPFASLFHSGFAAHRILSSINVRGVVRESESLIRAGIFRGPLQDQPDSNTIVPSARPCICSDLCFENVPRGKNRRPRRMLTLLQWLNEWMTGGEDRQSGAPVVLTAPVDPLVGRFSRRRYRSVHHPSLQCPDRRFSGVYRGTGTTCDRTIPESCLWSAE